MTVPIILLISGLIGLYVSFGGSISIKDFHVDPPQSIKTKIISGIIGGFLMIVAVILFVLTMNTTKANNEIIISTKSQEEKNNSQLINKTVKINSKFSFEEGVMGWVPQDYEDSRACTSVENTNEKVKEGVSSLKLTMELIGGDHNKSQGEAWVNMEDEAPNNVQIPINLKNKVLSAWVYCPVGTKGERNRPNGIQLFVKDSNWNGFYGEWNNISEGQWVKISTPVSSIKPKGGFINPGFDPSKIIAVGIKIGTGGGSKAKYNGPIFVDAIDW